MSWRWRAVTWGWMVVDRVYLTGVFLGPRGVVHVGGNVVIGAFFLLEVLDVISTPAWLSGVAFGLLLANICYSLYLQHHFKRRNHESRSQH